MSKEEKRKLYKCGSKFTTPEDLPTWPEYLMEYREKHHIPGEYNGERICTNGLGENVV